MKQRTHIAALACAVVSIVGCGDGVRTVIPIAPTVSVAAIPTPPAPPFLTGSYPPITGPGRVFVYRDSPYPHVQQYTLTSRFVLYDDGRFALQYALPVGEYRGTYTMTNGTIDFDWEGWSVMGPWDAKGTLNEDVLSVRFNDVMQLTDFEDANYTPTP